MGSVHLPCLDVLPIEIVELLLAGDHDHEVLDESDEVGRLLFGQI